MLKVLSYMSKKNYYLKCTVPIENYKKCCRSRKIVCYLEVFAI